MTALAGVALLSEGSTTTQGKYSKSIRLAVDYLLSRSRPNGLIGDPTRDDRYTYGHGYAMMFLSQILGEEEDEQRTLSEWLSEAPGWLVSSIIHMLLLIILGLVAATAAVDAQDSTVLNLVTITFLTLRVDQPFGIGQCQRGSFSRRNS